MAHKTVLITGVTHGIGNGICKRLIQENYIVHGTYNTADAAASQLQKECPSINLHKVDFTDLPAVSRLCDKLRHTPFNGMVNNAGIIIFETFSKYDYEGWDKTFAVNVRAPLFICTQLGLLMPAGSSIVNIASTDGLTGSFASIAYAASKAALINLTKSLANCLGDRNIRVNSISPGWINTGMSTPASLEAVSLTPLGRNGTPEDVADVVSFLLSDRARFITGANIIVDGGYTNVDYIMKKEACN